MVAAAVALLFFLQTPDYDAEGSKALDAGNYQAAADSFSKAIAADPADYFAHFNLARAYTFLKKEEDAIAEYRKTLELKPGLYEAELNEGSLLLHRNDPADALSLLEDAAKQKPADYFPHFNLAMADTYLKKDDDAIAEYRRTLELKPGLYEAELNQGILLLRQKNPADALPLLEDAVQQRPAEFAPHFYLGEAQLQTGSNGLAAENYRQAAGIDPQSATAELGWGRALALGGKLDEAAPHFRAAIQRDQRYHDSLLSLAELYEEHKQIDAALAIYREFPNNAEVQEHAGHLLLENQKYGDAVRELENAFQKSPTEANRKSLAAAYLQAGQIEKALPLLEKAVAEEPANYELRLGYAHGLRDSKNYRAAAAQFDEAAKLKPAETKTWNELGSMLYLAGDRDGALAALAQARQLGDNTPGNWFLTAIMLDAEQESNRSLMKDALAAYRKFLAVSDGKSPNQEFQARQRAKLLQRELDKR